MRIEFDVSIPPSINHCYWYRNGKRFRTEAAKRYGQEVIDIVRKAMDKQKCGKFNDKEKIICEMTYHFPDNRRRDSHNTFKILFDSIEEAGLYQDDRYILIRVNDICIDKANPRVNLKFYLKGE